MKRYPKQIKESSEGWWAMNRTLLKIIYVTISILLIGGVLYIGYDRYQQTNSEYQSAIDAASKIGIISQSIVNYANKLHLVNSRAEYTALMGRLEKLIDVLEIRHLSLFNGKPNFSRKGHYADRIKFIYYSPPYEVVTQVQNFLYHANELLRTPYKSFSPANEHLIAISHAVKGNMILSLSQLIRMYRSELEKRVNSIILYMLASLIFILVINFLAALYLFASPTKQSVYIHKDEDSNSVAPILNEIVVSQENNGKTPVFSRELSTAKVYDV